MGKSVMTVLRTGIEEPDSKGNPSPDLFHRVTIILYNISMKTV